MDGKNHELVLRWMFPFIAFYLGYIHSDFKLSFLFWILWIIGTYYITCDDDTKSRSSKRLGIIGKITNKLFKHHGLLHNPLFWAAVGVFGYIKLDGYLHSGWPFFGLIIPQGVHMLTDKIFDVR